MFSLVVMSLATAFTTPTTRGLCVRLVENKLSLRAADERETGVVELVDDVDRTEKFVAPFLSQGEISEGVLNPDLSDPKQARVIIYIILSLVPVLFLIPLILGNRDFIPMDALPPVIM